MFAFYLKKLLRCPATWVGALLFLASIVFSVSDTLDARNPTYLYEYAMDCGIAGFFVPVVTVLPVCFVQKELSRGGVWQLPLLRASPRRYAAGGLAAACLSGAVVTLAAFAGLFLGLVLVSGGNVFFDYALVPWDLEVWQDRSYLEVTLIELANLGLTSMMYPAVAWLVSGCSSNQYLCAAAPFLIDTLARYGFGFLAYEVDPRFAALDPGHLDDFWGVSPSFSRDPAVYIPLGVLLVVGYVMAVILVCGLLFRRRLERRLLDG